MEKKKRHRRTKAEMQAYRAEKAQKNADKYKAKVEKRLTARGSSDMKIIEWPPKAQPDDGKRWDVSSITGTESEMNAFVAKNKENCICGPYYYGNEVFRVIFWKEIV